MPIEQGRGPSRWPDWQGRARLFRARGQGLRAFGPALSGKVLPVGGMGLIGFLGGGGLGVIASGVNKPIEGARASHIRGQGADIAFFLIFLVVLSIMKGIQSGMISISRLLRSFSSESGDESKLLPSRYFASDNVNLLDMMLISILRERGYPYMAFWSRKPKTPSVRSLGHPDHIFMNYPG